MKKNQILVKIQARSENSLSPNFLSYLYVGGRDTRTHPTLSDFENNIPLYLFDFFEFIKQNKCFILFNYEKIRLGLFMLDEVFGELKNEFLEYWNYFIFLIIY